MVRSSKQTVFLIFSFVLISNFSIYILVIETFESYLDKPLSVLDKNSIVKDSLFCIPIGLA